MLYEKTLMDYLEDDLFAKPLWEHFNYGAFLTFLIDPIEVLDNGS